MDSLYWEMVWIMFHAFLEDYTEQYAPRIPQMIVERCMANALQQTNHFIRGHRGQELHDKCILLIDKYGYDFKKPDDVEVRLSNEGYADSHNYVKS